MANHKRTDDRILCLMLKAMLEGATLGDLIQIGDCHRATVFRYMSVLTDVYQVELDHSEGLYHVRSVGDDNIWRLVFEHLDICPPSHESMADQGATA